MGENTHQNCTRQNKNKEDPGRQQPCWGFLFCTKLTQPTGNLDSKNSQEVLALLQTMSAKYQQTILMITHNKNHASAADRIFNMSDGVLKELGASRK